jgi:hypothetical protein
MARTDAGRKRCAIYTRKSSEEGLEQEFNSLAAQHEACEAYIRSQQHEGWVLTRNRYDDGGFSGGNLERPALQQLIADIRAGQIDIVVVYKVDRLTRALADFARLDAIPRRQEGATLSLLRLRCPDHRCRIGSRARLAARRQGDRGGRDQDPGRRADQPGEIGRAVWCGQYAQRPYSEAA